MPPRRRPPQSKRPIESYDHRDKDRLNNPPVGLVTPETDRDAGRKSYTYDPHLDPQLQWAGKAEHTSFDVPTVSLHVHERIDPRTIIETTRKLNGNGAPVQGSLFELPEENPPVRSAIEFYQHRHNWTNRLVAGDSLLVMNSLLEKEGMAGKVQMVYIDPPYGIRYGSNFQPFVNKRDVRDGRDEDLTQEPETIKAFRDTWELGIHSYLSYLRDRLLLARDLLTESGSCFVQIGDENLHYIRELMDEVFGRSNLVSTISFSKTTGFSGKYLSSVTDYLVWYAKDHTQLKYRQLTSEKQVGEEGATKYRPVAEIAALKESNFEPTRLATSADLTSQGASVNSEQKFAFVDRVWLPPAGLHWKTTVEGMYRLALAGRVMVEGNSIRYVRFLDDFPVYPINNIWDDIGGIQSRTDPKRYVVQTANEAVKRCLLMTTDPGDLVFDPTCGSGTTAYVAEQWGRRWITCDTSRVAISLAKQRLMTALFDYYELAHPEEGVGSGFNYKMVPHVTLGSIANNSDIKEGMTQKEIDAAIAKHAPQETLYDQPLVDTGKKRVTGPFSVEAVPAPAVKPIDDVDDVEPLPADDAIARSGETLRQSDWRDELLKTGIRGKAGQFIRFARLEPLPDYRHPPRRWRVAAQHRRRSEHPRRTGSVLTAHHGVIWPRPRPLGAASGESGSPRGPDPDAAAEGHRLRRLPVRPRSCQGHRRDQLAGHHPPEGADERRSAHRGPEAQAGQQRELLAHRTAGRLFAPDRKGSEYWQMASCCAGVRLLQHQNRRRGIGWRGQDCHVGCWTRTMTVAACTLAKYFCLWLAPMAAGPDSLATLRQN